MKYQTALEWLAIKNLQNQEYRVLMYLMSRLDFENYTRISQKNIAITLEMQQGNVSRAIRGLLENDIIKKGPSVGTGKTYRLNPKMVYET